MINLILFEYKKFLKRKKNIISFSLFFILIVGYVIINNSIDQEKAKLVEKNYKLELDSAQDGLRNFQNRDDIPDVEKIINEQKEIISFFEERQKAHTRGDWETELQMQIEIDKKILEGVRRGTIISGEDTPSIQERIQKNEILLSKNIKPIIEDNSMESYNFLKLIIKDIFPLMLVILILILAGDVVSNENDDGTFKFLLLQPISRSKIILSKILAISSICIFSIFLILAIMFISLGIKFGLGNPHYPIKYFTGSYITPFNAAVGYNFEFVDIRVFILSLIPILILFIIAIVTLGILISTIIPNSTAAICTGIIVAVGVNIFYNQLNIFKRFAHINPLIYSNICELLNGNLLMKFDNRNLTASNGIIVLLCFTLICIIVSLIFFRKRDITC